MSRYWCLCQGRGWSNYCWVTECNRKQKRIRWHFRNCLQKRRPDCWKSKKRICKRSRFSMFSSRKCSSNVKRLRKISDNGIRTYYGNKRMSLWLCLLRVSIHMESKSKVSFSWRCHKRNKKTSKDGIKDCTFWRRHFRHKQEIYKRIMCWHDQSLFRAKMELWNPCKIDWWTNHIPYERSRLLFNRFGHWIR